MCDISLGQRVSLKAHLAYLGFGTAQVGTSPFHVSQFTKHWHSIMLFITESAARSSQCIQATSSLWSPEKSLSIPWLSHLQKWRLWAGCKNSFAGRRVRWMGDINLDLLVQKRQTKTNNKWNIKRGRFLGNQSKWWRMVVITVLSTWILK